MNNSAMLQEIDGLVFYPDVHKYLWEGRWVCHSISRIAQPLSPEDRANIDRYKDGPLGWEKRGNWTHAAAESILLGQDLPPDPEGLYQPWLEGLESCWFLKDFEVLATEFRLVDREGGLYAGSYDALIRDSKSRVCLVDFKSVSSARSMKTRKPATAQLGGYLSMHRQWFPEIEVERVVTCVICPGDSRVISEPAEAGLEAWDKALTAFKEEHLPW